MAYVVRRELDDGISTALFRLDRDPRLACPGGEVSATIRILAGGSISLAGIDYPFETIDKERRHNTIVGSDFPVFAANLKGARLIAVHAPPCVRTLIETTVLLPYCTGLSRYSSGQKTPNFYLAHTAEQHHNDVLDTLAELALYALYSPRPAAPHDLRPEEPHTPLSDPAQHE